MTETRNPCLAYSDPRLAALYDHINPAGEDLEFHFRLVGARPLRVLDMGCGTGRLAVRLAAQGHAVTGADPSPGMLNVAAAREGGHAVRWMAAGAASLEAGGPFDHIVMTGHAFQTLLEDEEVAAALRNLRRHLVPQGRFAFETRNPLVREWEGWTPQETREEIEVPGLGSVEVSYAILEAGGELVTFETRFLLPGGEKIAAPHRLRFMPQATLARLLDEAGFARVTWYGDFDLSPVTAQSPEIIAVAS